MASEIVVNEFVSEAREHLDSTECDLLNMESGDTDNTDMVNRVFRAVHSIKGASGTFGFPAIMELSHAMESVMLLFRDGKMTPDHHKISVLLEGVDKLRYMINDIHASDEVNCQSEVGKLQAILKEEAEPACVVPEKVEGFGKPKPATSDSLFPNEPKHDAITFEIKAPFSRDEIRFQVDRTQIADAISKRHFVCAIRVSPERDLKEKQRTPRDFLASLQTYGQYLDAKTQMGSESETDSDASADRPSDVLFATILEPDLIGTALELPDDQVHVIEIEFLKGLLEKRSTPPVIPPAPKSGCEPVASQQADKAAHQVSDTIRVNVGLLDNLINLAGELVLGRNQLRQMLAASVDENPRLRTVIQNVNLVTSEMQQHILRMRMQPLGNILHRIRRLARDLGRQLSKEVELITEGGDVELDKSILEGLSDPLIHIIRNCVDHGLEAPGERTAKGKPPVGEIRLRAYHEAGQVNITIADDGRGMNREKVVEKAIAKGILTEEDARKMSEEEKINLVFLPGFSTSNAVTDVSGRGVGMDVAKNNIEKFGGHIEIESIEGSGTTIRITIPLTLAIIPSLIVESSKQRFAIPQVNVREIVCIHPEEASRRIGKVGEAAVLRLRERLLPLVRLADTVGLNRSFAHPAEGREMTERRINIADRRQGRTDTSLGDGDLRQAPGDRRHRRQSDTYVVVLRFGGNLFGLIVDELLDIEEIVVKPLSDHIKDCQCFAGSTIMGDGSVAMILDAAGIAALARLRFAEINAEQLRRQREEQRRESAHMATRQSIIVFNNAVQEHFAMPLSSISRLEKIDPRAVERIGNRQFMNYGGKPLPLIRLESVLPVCPLPESSSELFVIIPKTGDSPVGILASNIVDTFESSAVVEKHADTARGFLGSALVEGRLTMFLDMEELWRMFRKEIHLDGETRRGREAP